MATLKHDHFIFLRKILDTHFLYRFSIRFRNKLHRKKGGYGSIIWSNLCLKAVDVSLIFSIKYTNLSVCFIQIFTKMESYSDSEIELPSLNVTEAAKITTVN